MEINNLSFQEQLARTSQISETESENEMNRELNDSELDAIAGGKFDFQTYLQLKGINLTSTPIQLSPLN